LRLSRELLRARRRRGTIRPLYATEGELGLARTLVSVYEDHIDGKRGELKEALSHCEELGYNYKLVRGLASVLENRCIFQTRAFVEPAEARRAVFDEAGNRVVATDEERCRVLAAAAFRLGVSAESLDESLYADLLDEQTLADFDGPTPEELLKEYNFALTLALLAQARKLELTYVGRDEEMELLGEALGRCRLHVTGGVSRLMAERRPSSRSGRGATALEELISRLMLHRGWGISAEVVSRSRSGKTYLFELGKESDDGLVAPSDLGRRPKAEDPARTAPTIPHGEVIIVADLASELGVTEAEARGRLDKAGGRYINLDGVLITPGKLGELERGLAAAPDMRLSTVARILRRLGCRRPLPVLEALGYTVEWTGDRGRSTVYRLGRRRATP